MEQRGLERPRVIAAALLLAALTGMVFAPAARNGYISLDDAAYVYDNPRVISGLSRQSVLWALTSTEHANWYPLRRLTHLVDASLFGMRAGAHHLVSVGWHAGAVVLLFLALHQMTGALWRCVAVAALFAVHPLQVESVAWAAERSTVLAGFFFGLTLLLWARYTRRPGAGRYGAVAASLALGLLAKPILMTVPILLALLDFWPLGRLGAAGSPPWRPGGHKLWQCLLEKVPLMALAAGSGAVAVVVHWQGGALPSLEAAPLGSRLGNAMLSGWRYLGKMAWPAGLAVYYPHPGSSLSLAAAVSSGLLLAVLTAVLLAQVRRRPWLGIGWLWYAVALTPMLGIVQFGTPHAMADRFAYLPAVGFFLALVWFAAAGLQGLRTAPVVGAVAAVAILAALGAATVVQVRFWRDSRTLFAHALASTGPNALVLTNLGRALAEEGRVAEALPLLEQAVRLAPRDPKARDGLGYALSLSSRPAEALEQFRAAVELAPGFVEGRSNLGIALAWNGRVDEARAQLLEALRIGPGYAEAHNNLGKVEDLLGRGEEAIARFRTAIELKPTLLAARFNLGAALLKAGRADEAATVYEDLLRISPGNARARALLDSLRRRPPL